MRPGCVGCDKDVLYIIALVVVASAESHIGTCCLFAQHALLSPSPYRHRRPHHHRRHHLAHSEPEYNVFQGQKICQRMSDLKQPQL